MGIRRYDVASFLTIGSPIRISTPGGIVMGVRPSLDGRAGVEEKCRGRLAGVGGVWRAGTRKLGRVATTGEEAEARSRERLGASMVAGGGGEVGRVRGEEVVAARDRQEGVLGAGGCWNGRGAVMLRSPGWLRKMIESRESFGLAGQLGGRSLQVRAWRMGGS